MGQKERGAGHDTPAARPSWVCVDGCELTSAARAHACVLMFVRVCARARAWGESISPVYLHVRVRVCVFVRRVTGACALVLRACEQQRA